MSELERKRKLAKALQLRAQAGATVDTGARPSGLREALGGAAFGFADEIEAALKAATGSVAAPGIEGGATFGERYRANVEDIRGAQEQFREENPGAALGLNIAGGVIPGVATGGATVATAGGGALARGLAAMPWWQRLLASSGLGATAGAGGGAVAGAGEAETLADVPGAMAEGARAGAAVGAAMGPAGEVMATPVQWARNRIWSLFAPERRGPERVRRTLAEAGLTPEGAAERLRSNRDAILADVGEGPRAELEFAAQAPGTTPQATERALRARAEAAPGEITDLIGEGRKYDILDELQAERAQSAGPLYEAAYARETPMSESLAKLWTKPTVQKFWKSPYLREVAQEIADAEDMPFDARMFDSETPSTMGWDYLIRGLDKRIGALKTSDPGRAKTLQTIRRQLRDEVGRQNPTLSEARSVWAGVEQYEEMMEEGGKFFNMRPDELSSRLSKMSEVDKDAFREGVNQAIQERVGRSGDTHSVTKFFKQREMWPKMRALFDDDAEFNAFRTRINQLDEQQTTFQQARPRTGSRTFRTGMRAEDWQFSPLAPRASIEGGLNRALTLGIPGTQGTRDIAGDILLMGPEEAMRALTQPYVIPRTRGAGLFPIGAAVPAGAVAVTAPEDR